jgi:predicted dehydrogenase
MSNPTPDTKRTHKATRRDFVQGSMSLFAAGYFSSSALAQSTAASEKLNIACIGTANRASEDIRGIAHENVVALCDVDENYLARKKKEYPDAETFADYREMIDKLDDKIDAVVVGTTDHHHAPATLRAIRAGKHVYCEKPLTHTVEEARIIAEAAEKAGVATQMGTQIHAGDNYRRVVEIVQAGTLGEITDVHVWVGKGWGEEADFTVPDGGPAPKSLDWDLWLGPAEERPFIPGKYHPAQWRRWWDFGQGTLGDMGCHYMDLPFWALELRHPTSVSAEGPPVNEHTAPLGLTVRYTFPSNNIHPGINLTWYDGRQIPKRINGTPVKANGVMFVGSEGMMFADYSTYRLFPSSKFGDFEPPKPSIPSSIGHHREWLQACRDGSPTTCNFDYSGALTESVLLGNVAYRSSTAFKWNGEKLQASEPKAQQLISKSYRKGWEVKA